MLALRFGLAPGSALFLGCAVAVSSTAVVLRGLATRGELEAPHGRLAVGILVFQDLCVVPMVLAVPFLSSRGGSFGEAALAIGIAVAILAGVLVSASLIVPRLLGFVARTRQRDLFVLAVFLVCFGIAYAVSRAQVSLALGAFLAGLVVAGSEYRHQALADLIPAREVLASLFFVSVGMLLDVGDVVGNLGGTLGLLAAILAGKFFIVLGTALILRLPLRVAILSAAALCQVGEFSFVLLGAAAGTGLLGPALSHNLLVAIILSMLLTPIAIAFGPRLASGAARVSWLNRRLGADPPGVDAAEPHRDHVIVAGYGLAGRAISATLREAKVPYVAVDMNPDNVRAAREAGDRAVLGDVTRQEVLEELGCGHARLVVISINDARATELAVRTIRGAGHGRAIVARTQYELDRESLLAAGATEVITAEATASDALVRAALASLDESPS
jgi:CPA2 family monovalent cation:H+ antiporter-2